MATKLQLTEEQLKIIWDESKEDKPEWKFLEEELEICKILDETRRKMFWLNIELEELKNKLTRSL